jgi:hypothetical protein
MSPPVISIESTRSRKGPLVLLVALMICIVASCIATYMVYGERIVYRERTSVRVWASAGVDSPGRTSAGPHDPPHWFAAMHRKSSRNIKMKARSEYTLGMVLVVMPRETALTLDSRGRGGWSISESTGREILVETGRISVGAQVFQPKNGRIVVIDGKGVASQHAFETAAQSSTQMQAAVDAFLAGQK